MLEAYRNTSCLLNNTVTKGQVSPPNKRLIPVSFQFSAQTDDPAGQRQSGSLQAQMNTALKNKIKMYLYIKSLKVIYMYVVCITQEIVWSSAPTCYFDFRRQINK